MAQDGASEFGKEALDKVEPGAVFGREGELEAVRRLIGKPRFGLLGDVRRMIVEDQLDRCVGRVGGVEKFEEFDEFAAAVAILDESVNLTSDEIDASQQADRPVALILVLAREGRMHAGLRRQVRGDRCDGLDTRLIIVRDDATSRGFFFDTVVAFFKSFTWR